MISIFSCTVLFVSISQVIGCEDHLRNDLDCVDRVALNSTAVDISELNESYYRAVIFCCILSFNYNNFIFQC